MKSFARLSITLVVCLCVCACSLFGPRMQTITISSDPEDADVIINGTHVGRTPLRYQVRRNDDLLVEIKKSGYETEYRTSHRTVSTLGTLDIIGGWLVLIPWVGLFSPAAWEHEPAAFGVILSPEDPEQPEPGSPEKRPEHTEL